MKKIAGLLLRFYKNNWVKYFVIPVILFTFWIVLSLVLNSYVSFTTLTTNYNHNTIIQSPHGSLLKGESIVGEFTAKEDNLGILSVHFAQKKQVAYDNQDVIVFKIKEKGARTWLYQNRYHSNAIAGLPLYPFGFPVFTNSKQKTYIFSITSLNGNKTNALDMNNKEPVLVSRYVFSKRALLANKKKFIGFLIKKFITSFTDIPFLIGGMVYLLPFFLYLIWIGIFEKIRGEKYHLLFIMPLLILLAMALHIELLIGFFYALIGFWVITIIAYNVESSVSFFFAFLFFLFAFILILFGNQELGGRFSNWTYIFLVIGAVQLPWELRNPSKKRLDYTKLLQSLQFKFIKKKSK